jgi:serine/threonine protein kinase
MGVVYRAEDATGPAGRGQVLSVKLLQGRVALERFQRKRAASSLNHPNICALFDVGQHGDLPFLVMELLQARRWTTNQRRAPADGCGAQMAVQIADALDAAHALGIIHTTSRPNIFVTDRGRSDCGLRPGQAV